MRFGVPAVATRVYAGSHTKRPRQSIFGHRCYCLSCLAANLGVAVGSPCHSRVLHAGGAELALQTRTAARSEERPVGKGCSNGGAPHRHQHELAETLDCLVSVEEVINTNFSKEFLPQYFL